jgi:SRSO17 transposase
VASWPEDRWQRLQVAEGEKGPRLYDWTCQRIVESHEQLPGRDAWLLARRSTTDPTELAYYLSNAPSETDLLTLAQVASTRYTVEQCIEEAKGETGLDHYEVRYWHSWYRHITLSLMAHAWLAAIRLKHTQEKGGMNPSWLN